MQERTRKQLKDQPQRELNQPRHVLLAADNAKLRYT
jgi:hypothetical protein